MIFILKLDHRPFRDKRITTHCALVSRAFGANCFYYSGVEDNILEKNILNINKQWGSDFQIKFIKEPMIFTKNFIGVKIHLTMYGDKITKKINKIIKLNNKKNLLIIVGGPKVNKFYYEIVDYNISITNQPHSEVAALAITLNLLNPDYLNKDFFKNNQLKIIPNNKNKKVMSLK